MKPTVKREIVKLFSHSYLTEYPVECHVFYFELPPSEMPVLSIILKMTKHHLRRLRWCGRSRGVATLALPLPVDPPMAAWLVLFRPIREQVRLGRNGLP